MHYSLHQNIISVSFWLVSVLVFLGDPVWYQIEINNNIFCYGLQLKDQKGVMCVCLYSTKISNSK